MTGWLDEHDWLRLIRGEARGSGAALARLALGAMTPGYRMAVQGRNRLFDAGLRHAARLPRPTISVGNLTAGGTGKTPMVAALVERLLAIGESPAVLLRGYKSATCGPTPGGSGLSSSSLKSQDSRLKTQDADEALALRAELGPTVPVWADPSRQRGAAAVIERHPGVSVFMLDDGFQHRQAARDLDLVLIDATQPFGFGRLLPRGLLREPLDNLQRADAVIVTRADRIPRKKLEELDATIARYHGKPPLAHVAYRWASLRQDDVELPLTELAAARVLSACGIGNGQVFTHMLREAAGEVIDCRLFGDHHAYRRAELDQLFEQALAGQAQAVVTTEKDWVKWQPLLEGEPPLPVWRPTLKMDFLHGEAAVVKLLGEMLRVSSC